MNRSSCLWLVFFFLLSSFRCGECLSQEYLLGFNASPSNQGVMVQSITAGGAMSKLADNAGRTTYAEPRDVVVSVNGRPTPNLQTLKSVLSTLGSTNGRATIGLLNHRTQKVEYYTTQAQLASSGGPSQSGANGQAASYVGIGITAAPARVGQSSGMVIQAAFQNSPLLAMRDSLNKQIRVDNGDVLLSIDGRPTSSGKQLVNAYQQAGQNFRVSLYDSRTRRISQFTASKGGVPNAVQPGTGRIFVLLAGMVDKSIGNSVKKSVGDMQGIVKGQVETSKLGAPVVSLLGEGYGLLDITGAIQAFNTGPNDAIFVYYIGHGYWGNQGHVLDMPSGDLIRTQLTQQLKAKNARLTVLLTESCSGEKNTVDFASAPYRVGPQPPQDPRLLQTMLLKGRGFVDVNSSSRGQLGFGNSGGGFFSRYIYKKLIEKNPGLTWSQLVSFAKQSQRSLYSSIREKEMQVLQQRKAQGVLDSSGDSVLQALQKQTSLDAQINELSVN